jgi:polypeptide N-acetylgalactosaminyltransferase
MLIGEMGNPVKIKDQELTSDQRIQYDKLFKLNAFNQYASDMISLHRRLVDVRNDA